MMVSTVHGNYFDKYSSGNPLIRYLMRNFRRNWLELMTQTGLTGTDFNILEVGCGDGAHLEWYNSHTGHKGLSVGLELGLDVVSAGHRQFPDITFVNGSIYQLPFENNQFDVVVVPEVFEHLEKPEEGLREAVRVSARYILASVPWEPVWRLSNIARLAYLKNLGNTPGHVQHFNRGRFLSFMSNQVRIIDVRKPFPWSMVLGEI